jgi:hypothetical protein
LIVWGPAEDPIEKGRSPVGASDRTLTDANLTGVEGPLHLTPGNSYYWGVRLLSASGTPVRMLSGGRLFVYERAASSGGGQTCTGTDCDK